MNKKPITEAMDKRQVGVRRSVVTIMDKDEIGFFAKAVSGAVVAFIIVVYILGISVNRLMYTGEIAEIERVRIDIKKPSKQNAEDVYGEAVKLNRKIASNRAYNSMWWSDWLVPDGWDHVEFIDIPSE